MWEMICSWYALLVLLLVECGRSPWRSRYGYSEDDPFRNDVPWTATLVLKKFQNVFCGGALLNDRTVGRL